MSDRVVGNRPRCHTVLGLIALLLVAGGLGAWAAETGTTVESAAWYVDGDSTSATPDGLAWASAFTSIQAGVDAASVAGGGEVWVAEGTYAAVVMTSGVHLYGDFTGNETSRDQRDWNAHTTIIANGQPCVVGAEAAGLDGFRITGGTPGMTIASGTPSIRNCTFSGNVDRGAPPGPPSMGNYGNGAPGDDASDWALVISGGVPVIENCVFSGNGAEAGSGGAGAGGGYCVKFSGGAGGDASGGGVEIGLSGGGTFVNCVFFGNFALPGAGGTGTCSVECGCAGVAPGGAVTSAGAIWFAGTSLSVMNCTFSGNTGGIVNASGNPASIVNSIIWADSISNQSSGVTDVAHSDVQGGYSGAGNINSDPLFVNISTGDLQLVSGSPCLDTGTPVDAPLADILGVSRPQGLGVDMGAYERVVNGTLTVGMDSATPALTNVSPIPVSVTFSRAVTDFEALDIVASNGTVTNLVSVGGGGGGGGATGAGGGGSVEATFSYSAHYTFDLVPTSQGEVGADIPADLAHDEAGIGNSASPHFSRTYDSVTPLVASVACADATPTTAQAVTFAVLFSEDVTGVDAADFALTSSGDVAGAQVTGIAGNGAAYTVTVDPGTGTGTIRLDVVDDDSIVDGATNALGGTGSGNGNYEAGCTYVVVEPLPVAAFSADVTSGVAPLTVHFSDLSTPGGAAITSWAWTFGDGGTSSEQHPVHTYANVGSYDVSLTVLSALGTNTATRTGWVTVTPGLPDGLLSAGPESDSSDVYWDDLFGGTAGPDGNVYALAVDGRDNVYVGGQFSQVNGVANTSNIAEWNGSTWSPVGTGLNAMVWSLVFDGTGNLYAGGDFTTAGGVAASHVAKWDGVEWTPLGTGVDARVYALAIDGSGNLYAGGTFMTAGGLPANRVAKWDGVAWTALGSGADNEVWTLAVDRSGMLYAGGPFTVAGGVADTKFIARWDGAAWSPLGTGMSNFVRSLAFDHAGTLYAAGWFNTAGGVTVNRVARWDGTVWSALGTGVNLHNIYVLTTDGSGNLYAGGAFTEAGGVTAHYLARWDGAAWSALGTGTDHWVHALAAKRNTLFIGGYFANTGAKPASHFGVWQPRVNLSGAILSESPGALCVGNDTYGFYKPALQTDVGTIVSHAGGLPVTVRLDRAQAIQVGGIRVNGALTLGPEGVEFGGTGATLRVEFSEDDAAAYSVAYTEFRAVRLVYPADYPVNEEAAFAILLAENEPVPLRIENGKQIYGITVPITAIESTYGAVPQSLVNDGSIDGVWFVDADHTLGTQDGRTWATAFATLQQGVDAAAVEGGEVWVAEGTYTAIANPVLMMRANVRIFGGFAGSETAQEARKPAVHATVIDGENARRCVLGASNATLDGFTITRGHATGSGTAAIGGAMYNKRVSPIVANCTFSDNAAATTGGALYNNGGAPAIVDCRFLRNTATYAGGIFNYDSSATIANCVFSENVSTNVGGALYNVKTSAVITNCVFVANSATNGAGIFSETSCTPVVINCSFARNTGGWANGIRNGNGAATVVRNCILWNTGSGVELSDASGLLVVSNSDVRGGYAGEANIAEDPRFVDATTGNLQLMQNSPCIDAGAARGVPSADILGVARPQGAGVDMGAYESSIARPTVLMTSTTPNVTNVSPIPVAVMFSRPVAGFEALDILASNGTVMNLVSAGGGGGGGGAAGAGGGGSTQATLSYSASYIFDLVPAGQGEVGAGIPAGSACDEDGIGNLAAKHLARVYDSLPPAVTAVACADASPTQAASVVFSVTFSEDVTGVDASDFVIVPSEGLSGAQVTAVGGGNGAYAVTVGTGTGSGTLRLDVVDDDSIQDAATNPLGGTGAGNGEYNAGASYTLDRTPPTASFSANTRIGMIQFTDTSVSSSAPITAWAWTFGDGATSTEQNPAHVYEADGQYTVALTVTNEWGANTVCIPITVQSVWFVNAANTSAMHDGRAWPTAFLTIQEGVNAAALYGGQVWVARGTYTATGSSVVNLAPSVALYGGFTGTEVTLTQRDWNVNLTKISGGTPCVNAADLATIDGFWITAGHPGMVSALGSPSIRNCRFVDNVDIGVGGVSVMDGNYGTPGESASDWALVISGGAPVVESSFFLHNGAQAGDGAGAPAYNQIGNGGDGGDADGGAVRIDAAAGGAFINCVFAENFAQAGTGGSAGCTRVMNTQTCGRSGASGTVGDAGAIHFEGVTLLVTNCTFFHNTLGPASTSGSSTAGIVNASANAARVLNSIFRSSAIENGLSGTTVVTYSDVEGGYQGEGNIDQVPLFADTAGADLHLLAGSPCIDAGTPSGAPSLDVQGTLRPQGTAFDMGAYEYVPGTEPPVPVSVVMASTAPDATNVSPIPVTVTFSRAVTAFDAADILASNGTILNLVSAGGGGGGGGAAGTGGGGSAQATLSYSAGYTFDLIPAAQGEVAADIPANVAHDADYVGNIAAPRLSRVYDTVQPTLVSIEPDAASPTHAAAVAFTVSFSEPVLNLDTTDLFLNVTDSLAYEQVVMTGGPQVFVVHVTALEGVGFLTLAVNVPSDVADAAGNPLVESALAVTVAVEHTRPIATIVSDIPEPTNITPMLVGVTFSEPVSGFEASDVVVGNATLDQFEAVTSVYSRFWLTPIEQGRVTADVPENIAMDETGCGNVAAASFVRTFDSIAPDLRMESDTTIMTNVAPIPVAVRFSEPVVGFDETDVVLVNGTLSGFRTISETYAAFDVMPVDQGRIVVDIPAGSGHDAATNGTPSAHLERIFDSIAPSLSVALSDANPSGADTNRFQLTFSEPVTASSGWTLVPNGSLASIASLSVSGGGASFVVSADVSGNGDDGTIGLGIAGVFDLAGNACPEGLSDMYRVYRWRGFSAEPMDAKLYEGDPWTLTVAAPCNNPALSYRWKWEDAAQTVHVVGSNASVLTLDPVTESTAGTYWCEVDNGGVTRVTRRAAIAVAPHLRIVAEPTGGAASTGESFTFAVQTAGGHAPLSYQWKQDGRPILNTSAGSSFTLTGLVMSDAGRYSVTVADSGADSIDSSSAVLTVLEGLPAMECVGLAAVALSIACAAVRRLRKR